MTEQTGNNKPNEAEGLAFPLSGNKKLIDSVRDWPTITRMSHSTQLEKLVELRDALEAAGKALTPTDDERGDLIGAASAAFNARGGAPEWEDDEIARDLIIRWHLRGFEDGEKFGRRPEVPELPTPEAWRDSIVDERCQQPSKGYTSDHDREHGLDHLLEWAQEYARIGEPLKSAALIEAARDLHRAGEVPEPSADVRQVLAWIDRTLALPLYQGGELTDYADATVTALRTVRKMLDGSSRPDASWRSAEPQGEPSDARVLEGFLGKLAGDGAYTLDFSSAASLHDHIVRLLKRDIAALRAAGATRG